jgi:PAS domain S-box-containing protein
MNDSGTLSALDPVAMAQQVRAFQDLTRELDAIIDSSSDGLWICDADARVIRINPSSERINNIKAHEVVGKNMRELLEQGFIDRSAALEAITSGAAVSLLQNREGRKLISTGTPVLDGNGRVIRVVVSERDITEIDNLQRELEEQEALRDQFRSHMLELRQADLASKKVIARSPAMVKALKQALKVSAVNSTVLILGESGVGKGVIADLIQKNSSRAEKPLIEINCGAIPESLIESELFGYEKGAFTGAQSGGKPGYLELADGGILFLDEIAELPRAAQVKLLRFLENGRVVRLGGTKARTLDVRIIAATHRDLDRMVQEGTFRLDLYYRLNVIPIQVPALRDRRDCILPLIRYYIDCFGARDSLHKRLTAAATDALVSYDYPGNVRQLMNICERLVVMTDTDLIDVKDLPAEIAAGNIEKLGAPQHYWPAELSLQETLESVERAVLQKALERHGNQVSIAQSLGVNQSTVARKLKKHGLCSGA